MRRREVAMVLAMLAVGAAAGGCASMGVQPWERDVLSQPGMTPGEDIVTSALDEHIYFSKEASTGGLGSGGGGCGCN
ncbi:MAG: DUF4266 domain-containing protein [bacterium]|nr:DUF4266 domain-containing protein [bacterium]